MKFTLKLAVPPSLEREFLSRIANLTAEMNAALFASLKNPPRCAASLGIKYRAPSRAEHLRGDVTVVGARELTRMGYGTCGDLAAFDAGAALARGIAARVRIVDGPWGPGSYHAIVVTPHGTWDPTETAIRGGSSCLF